MTVETPVTASFQSARRLSPGNDPAGAMYEIRFRMLSGHQPARPGQFYMVRPAIGSAPLLPRPLAPFLDTRDEIAFGIRVIGDGTRRMIAAMKGEPWTVLGPYGNGFDAPVTPREKIWLVGGGIGVPPLVHLASQYPSDYTAIIGAKTGGELHWTRQFGGAGVFLSTDDGSEGFRGTAADLLRHLLSRATKPDRIITCGPHPLMAATAAICRAANIRCDVSLEERMACGTGICISCVCRIRTPDGNYRHARVCAEGPVFPAEEVHW
ncbi:MAG: dihydroorotate dehydrogenase electron transfer subunit [Deltaproteobacteria bacterium]|nr:dihydroorotate dehydrogenase electron transfer subunit [Deltaproteobacteria bacterium]